MSVTANTNKGSLTDEDKRAQQTMLWQHYRFYIKHRLHDIALRTGKSKDYVVNNSFIGCTRCAHGRGICYNHYLKGEDKQKARTMKLIKDGDL